MYALRYASPTKFSRIACLNPYLPPSLVRACPFGPISSLSCPTYPRIWDYTLLNAFSISGRFLSAAAKVPRTELVILMALQLDHKGYRSFKNFSVHMGHALSGFGLFFGIRSSTFKNSCETPFTSFGGLKMSLFRDSMRDIRKSLLAVSGASRARVLNWTCTRRKRYFVR